MASSPIGPQFGLLVVVIPLPAERGDRANDRAVIFRIATGPLGVYRFWRDLGYAIGPLSAGLIADFSDFAWAIVAIGGLTFLSGGLVAVLVRTDPENAYRKLHPK